MPGIFGYHEASQKVFDENFLSRMSFTLEPEERFKVDLYREPSFGMGRVTLGISNPESQPIWNEDKSLCVMMEGELYNYQYTKQELVKKGHQFQVNNDAEFLLHLFEENGDDFAINLNGAYIAAIWDHQSQRLLIVNDRLGLYPLYYAFYNDRLLFGSGVRALMADRSLPRDIDQVAIAEFLTFDHVLGDRTLLESVRLLPQASILTFYNQQLKIRAYWNLKYPTHYPLKSEKDYLDELLQLFEQAVIRRMSHDDHSSGILLSGGLDSRILVAYLQANTRKKPFHSFTFGIPGCDDARFSKAVSKVVGTDHHFFELKPDWLLDKADEAVRITDGMGNLVSLHAFATIEKQAEFIDVLYKGVMGDNMMGSIITQHLLANYDSDHSIYAILKSRKSLGKITFDLGDHRELFSDSFKKNIGSGVMDEFKASLKTSGSEILADQTTYFEFCQRFPRMTIFGVEMARDRTMVRIPFCDNDLVEFFLSVPPGLRYGRRLEKNALIQKFPKLAQVPVTGTNLPIMIGMRDVLMRLNQILRWHLHHSGIKGISPEIRRPYKDYDNWFRTTLRQWIEEKLLSDLFIQRGYYNPSYIHNLVAEHMMGVNHAVRMGSLASIELWHRQFID